MTGILLGAVARTQAALHRYEFNVTEEVINPDCHIYGYNVPVINGQFPGPTIRVQRGDEVEILIRNGMDEHSTGIHYHGIRQIGTVESDGVPGITQNPILPGAAFIHKFKVEDQAGTYFYHAHVGLQDDSVKGAFIVYESEEADPLSCAEKAKEEGTEVELKAGPYTYKNDLVLQLSEWWHDELRSRESYFLSDSFVFDQGADSVLVNGRTVFDPEREGLSAANCQGYTTFDVEPNTTYRLRVIGGTTFRTLGLAIKDHNMTLIEVDGELTKPYDTSFLEISPGQRYSVLLHTGDYPPGKAFAIGTGYLWRQAGNSPTENGFGYIRYKTPANEDQERYDNEELFESKHLFKTLRTVETSDSSVLGHKKRAERAGNPIATEKSKLEVHGKSPAEADPAKVVVAKAPENDVSGSSGRGSSGIRSDRGDRSGRGGRGGSGGRGGGHGGRDKGGPKHVYPDLPTFPENNDPDWFYHNIEPLTLRNPLVDEFSVRTIKLSSSYRKLADNTTRYMVNQRIAPMRPIPAIFQYKSIPKQNRIEMASLNTQREYNPVLDSYPVKYNETLDLVFQNTIRPEVGGCLLHPWHTHGHSHYVIASGPGEYEHERDENIRNFKHPLYRDTSIAYPSNAIDDDSSTGCGWTKVRILAVS